MQETENKNCVCEKQKTGIKKGILYGILPHSFCILFIVFSLLGITVFSSLIKPFLSQKYSFLMLAILSIVLATISAIVYLKKSQALCLTGIKNKWKYLLSLYGSVVFVNLIMVYLIFPAFANTNFQGNALGASVMLRNYSTIALKVNIPCSGHAYLVIDELKNINGVKDVKFRSPNLFDVYFDSRIISQEQILSLPIFEDFSATKVGN